MKKESWIPVSGSVEITKNGVLYKPVKAKKTANNIGLLPPPIPIGTGKSSTYFENGSISFKVKLSDGNSSCLFILNEGRINPIYVGLNINSSPYAIATVNLNQFNVVASSGLGTKLASNKWYEIIIKVYGSHISLSVDDVVLVSAELFVENRQLGIYFSGEAEVEVKNIIVKPIKPRAFVVMQFSKEFDDLFSEVIKPACEEFDLECIRGDDMYTNGLIIDDITRSIKDAYIIIADITPNNPNVFYEVGYAHGIGKPVILLCNRDREKLPFDVSGIRTIYYDDSIAGKTLIEERLKKHLENITTQRYGVISSSLPLLNI